MLNQRTFFASLIIQPVQQTLLMHHTPVASVWCILQVIPFTPSAGVLEWVDGTVPLLEYLLGSTRAGGAHGRYGAGDWTFMACREHMSTETDKRRAYQTVCSNFRCTFSLSQSYTHLSILNEMNYQW
jgi:hypothetical protein